ncbi:hypothetical protein CDAR_65351 [Caerostris darwini]|uniref:Uncharacterized protein n=1 Tax=Caerostris darwini TaxID=1538125 RepID=A0AAV4W766_9ARAC|nr:hypothetical protein CDAR_65351 [Caerostris darwini]
MGLAILSYQQRHWQMDCIGNRVALLSSERPGIKTNKNTIALQPVLSSTTDGKYLFPNAILPNQWLFLPSIVTPDAAIAVTLMADLSIDQGSIVNTVMQKGIPLAIFFFGGIFRSVGRK